MKFEINISGVDFSYNYDPVSVFLPTATSMYIAEILTNFQEELDFSKTLDLGCGIGLLAHYINKKQLTKSTVYGSDISSEAIKIASDYARLNNIKSDFRVGPLLEPWSEHKFSLIINDVSGLSEEVIQITTWFTDKNQSTGEFGDELTLELLPQAAKHLKPGGKFITVVMGLQRREKIINSLYSNFKTVKEIGRRFWPLNDELKAKQSILENLQKQGKVELVSKWGMLGWYTYIYLGEK